VVDHFDRVTVDTGPTRWLTSEFGAALAIALSVTAWVFWRRRAAVAESVGNEAGAAPSPRWAGSTT